MKKRLLLLSMVVLGRCNAPVTALPDGGLPTRPVDGGAGGSGGGAVPASGGGASSMGGGAGGGASSDLDAGIPDAGPRADAGVDAGTPPTTRDIVIAAAGDISPQSVGKQRDTSDLLVNKGYDAVLLLGDNQYQSGTLEEYTGAFDKTWGRVKDLLLPAPGNHEYYTPGAAGYFQYFGAKAADPKKGYYSIDLGAWHLVALNTNDKRCGIVACDANSAQVKWLKADLAATKKKCILAFWHHPRFNSGDQHGNQEQVQALWDALYEAKADLVLNGHEHTYERFAAQNPQGKAAADGIVEFVVGTGGASLYDFGNTQPNSLVRENKTFGVLELTLKESSYSFRFVPVKGSNFTDTGEAECH